MPDEMVARVVRSNDAVYGIDLLASVDRLIGSCVETAHRRHAGTEGRR